MGSPGLKETYRKVEALHHGKSAGEAMGESACQLHFVCVHVCTCHSMCLGVRGKSVGIDSPLPIGSGDQTQVIRLDGKCLYPMSNSLIPSPIYFYACMCRCMYKSVSLSSLVE